MRLNDLTNAVLHEDIKRFLGAPDDSMLRAGLYSLALNSISGDAGSTWLPSASGTPTMALQTIMGYALTDPGTVDLLSGAKQMGADTQFQTGASLGDLGVALGAVAKIVVASAVWQVGALFGDQKGVARYPAGMSPGIFTAVAAYVRATLDAVDRAVLPADYAQLGEVNWASAAAAYSTAFGTSAPRSYLNVVRKRLRDAVRDPNVMPRSIQQWIFPVDPGGDAAQDGPMLRILASAFQPYFVFRYFASFVQGSWNTDAVAQRPLWQRYEVEFYDERYARQLLMDVLTTAMTLLAQAEDGARWTALNQTYSALVADALNRSRTETGDQQLKAMYGSVSKLSADTKASTLAIADRSERFERRRGYIQSMYNNLSVDERELARRRRVFWTWVAAYVAVAVVGVALVAMRMNAAFMLHAGAVTLVVVLVALVNVVRAWIASSKQGGGS